MYSIVYLYSSLERVTLLEYIRNLGGLGEACNFTLGKKCIVNFSKRLPLRSLFVFRYLPFPSVARVYPLSYPTFSNVNLATNLADEVKSR